MNFRYHARSQWGRAYFHALMYRIADPGADTLQLAMMRARDWREAMKHQKEFILKHAPEGTALSDLLGSVGPIEIRV